MRDYTTFIIISVNKSEVCNISVFGPLNDCSDKKAEFGNNDYLINVERPGGLFVSGVIHADSLADDRMLLETMWLFNLRFYWQIYFFLVWLFQQVRCWDCSLELQIQ